MTILRAQRSTFLFDTPRGESPIRRAASWFKMIMVATALGCGVDGGPVQDSSAQPRASSGSSGKANTSTSDAGPMDASSTETDSGQPSTEFRTIYDTILFPNCGRCHNHASAEPGQLNMRDAATALATLVNVPPWGCAVANGAVVFDASYRRVVPFDPDQSLLMYVNNRINCSSRHAEDVISGEFSAGYLGFNTEDTARIRSWILSGAR